MSTNTKIAIIGAGPRGLAIAEQLTAQADQNGASVFIHFFDPCKSFGAGPNFNPDDSDLSLLNLPAYDVDLAKPDGEDEQSFQSWHKKSGASDDAYPPRSTLGKWLEERFATLKGSVETTSSKVESITKTDDGWTVTTEGGKSDDFTHVIISVSQPQSAPDRAVARWLDHIEKTSAELLPVYPANELGKAASKWKGKTIAIRGFGLSTLDALRQLTVAQGGSFTEEGYKPSGKEPEAIYIFSKDGLSLHPKPDGQDNDAKFDVTAEEKANFEEAVASALTSQPKDALAVIFAALNAPATRILDSFDAAPRSEAISTWLTQEEKQPGSQYDGELSEILQQSHDMAKGSETPDVGYVLGQVWRKLQDSLSNVFDSTDEIPDETRKNLIAFDEGFKRYSYGPPVETFSELRHLIEAGLVKLELVNNPTVSMTDNGWKLRGADEEIEVSAMVDAVLPEGDLASVTDTAISTLRDENHLSANSVGGAAVSPRGEVLDAHGKPVKGLYLVGRLASGSVIGADTLKHCFGEGTERLVQSIVNAEEGDEAAA
jgi:uncharacterized NAD(P)/FAD-binding protein YdhS